MTQLFVKQLFEKWGDSFNARANTPFLLDDPHCVWLVLEGNIDVFAVNVTGGRIRGRRFHLFRVDTSHLLFGFDSADIENHVGCLAVGATGTRVAKLPLSQFQELMQAAGRTETLAHLCDSWIIKFSFALSRNLKPQTDVLLAPGRELGLSANQKARSRNGVVWGNLVQGRYLFLGMEELSSRPEALPFPLTEDSWVETVTVSTIITMETVGLLKGGMLWKALAIFHQFALACTSMNQKLSLVDEFVTLKDRSLNDAKLKQDAFLKLSSVMVKPPFLASEWVGDDPLLVACRLVGQRMGINIKNPARESTESGDTIDSQVRDIARVSHIQTRRVVLREDWWRSDGGPILGFIRNTHRPVALLPASPRSYVLVDPLNGVETAVDKGIVRQIHPVGYTFYRTFPSRPLTTLDLARIGLRGIRRDVSTVILTAVGGALLALAMPVMTGIVFDTVVPEASRSKLAQIVFILLSCVIVSYFFELTKAISLLRLKGKIDPVVEAAVLDRMISLPPPFFRRFSVGDLANRSLGICAISKILSDATLQTILAIVFSSLNFILLFWYERRLALIAVGLSSVAITCTMVSAYFQMRYQKILSELEGKISGVLLQLVNGISKLRISGTEGRAFAVWAKLFTEKKRFVYKNKLIQNLLDTFNGVFPLLASMAIFSWVVLKTSKSFTTGNFIAFNVAYTNFQNALLQMSAAVMSLLNIVPYYQRAKPILESRPEVDADKENPGKLKGHVEVSHVSFRYSDDGPNVIKDVSFHLNPGEFVALVGSSGSGKSTLLRLLLGFEHPHSGTIFYDGRDLAKLNLQEVRRQLGVVMQNGGIMPGTIYKNIAGTTGIRIDSAWQAATLVGLNKDIEAMPDGMHTVLDAGGYTLSGGQRQRLLIARAIVNRPRILYFDEATSALDNHTQEIVTRNLERLQATRLIIAHRLSTVVHADRIVVLDKGQVAETGTYNELLDQNGLFAKLAKRQIV